MDQATLSRRTILKAGGASAASLGVMRLSMPAAAFQGDASAQVIPWLDQPEENPIPEAIVRQLVWEDLDSWITPNDEFFVIKHYDEPQIDASTWRLEISGLVDRPMSLSLADLQARERHDVTVTLECSGNSAFPFNKGLVSNAIWSGPPLALILQEAGIQKGASDVVFWGADAGEQIWRDVPVVEHFARSMTVSDALDPNNLIATEMNGESLPALHGFPARLIAPGWYGVANVKWLTRIEVRDSRYQGHFMARDYVTIREETFDGEPVWTFSSVGRDRLKSAPAKVTRSGDTYNIMGAAWGAPIIGVEVRIDDGEWQPATITEGDDSEFTWAFWTYDWGTPSPGDYVVTSRAIDAAGQIQPAPDDPFLTAKSTFWESNGQISRQIRVA